MRAVTFALLSAVSGIACDSPTLELLPSAAQEPAGKEAGASDSGDLPAAPFDSAPVGCRENDDCGGRRGRCDIGSGRCVECLAASDCDPSRICDPIGHRCALGCNDDRDCPRDRGQRCSASRGVCIECEAEAECSATPFDSHCDTMTGMCESCLADEHCVVPGIPGLYCDLEWHECIQCRVDLQCSGETPFCESERGYCMQCRKDAHCIPGSYCDTSVGICFRPRQ